MNTETKTDHRVFLGFAAGIGLSIIVFIVIGLCSTKLAEPERPTVSQQCDVLISPEWEAIRHTLRRGAYERGARDALTAVDFGILRARVEKNGKDITDILDDVRAKMELQ